MRVQAELLDALALGQILADDHAVDQRVGLFALAALGAEAVHGDAPFVIGGLFRVAEGQRPAIARLEPVSELSKPLNVLFGQQTAPIGADVDEEVRAAAHAHLVDAHQLVGLLDGVLVQLAVEPGGAHLEIALGGQELGARQLFLFGGQHGEIHVGGGVEVGHGRVAVLVAHPAGIGIPHGEDQDFRLHPANGLDDAVGVILMALAAAAIEPQIVDLAVAGQQLADLIDEIIVVFAVFLKADLAAPLRRRIIQADFQSILAAGVDIFAHDVALAVLPGRGCDGVIGVFGRPVGKAVVVLAHEDGVGRARVLNRADPLLAVQLLGVERLGGHGAVVPVLMAEEEAADTEMEEHAVFPVHKGQLAGAGPQFHRIHEWSRSRLCISRLLLTL